MEARNKQTAEGEVAKSAPTAKPTKQALIQMDLRGAQTTRPRTPSALDPSTRKTSGRIGGSAVSLMSYQRCGHPGQQHGLRMPPRILSMPTSIRRFLVASCLAEVTQQIHSFRANGVMSAQRLLAGALDSMALRKSAGSLWTVPLAMF